MAFGFPAYAIDNQNLNVDSATLRSAVRDAFSALGWSYETIDSNTFIARIPFSFFSWGERLTISFTEDGAIEAKSEGILATQCIDWGKNKRNIKMFFSQLAQTTPLLFSLDSYKSLALFDETGTTPVEKVFREYEK
ncbi:MAG TPA: hypothetical protein VF556_16790 [Pyrinomonadaceae bacterium]|jgi:hypothetical protein